LSTNGKLPSSALKLVQHGKWDGREADIYLATGTGNAYLAMVSACHAAGFSIEIAEPMGGYRPYADQAQMRADWYAHNWMPYNLDPHSTVPPAPAGTSNHGLGLCADVWGTGYQWAIQNAHRWGFSRPFPETDPHHFQHDGKTATAALGSSPISNTTSATTGPEEDDDMSKNVALHYTRAQDKARVILILNTDSGWYHEYTTGSVQNDHYDNPIAAAFQTGSYQPCTEDHARVLRDACDRVVAGNSTAILQVASAIDASQG
jgi:hypothetical protein